jgi:hypothetical protein
MAKKESNGKTELWKGAMVYLWEELKTMNRVKFRALRIMASGYVKMKLKRARKSKARPRNSISLIER